MFREVPRSCTLRDITFNVTIDFHQVIEHIYSPGFPIAFLRARLHLIEQSLERNSGLGVLQWRRESPRLLQPEAPAF